MFLQKLYSRLPVALQDLACSAEGWRIGRTRYGSLFEQRLPLRSRLLGARAGELQELRLRALRKLLQSAATSRFWGERFQECGIDPEGVDPLTEISKLPVLAKSEIQARSRDFLTTPNGALSGGALRKCHTSGTTGAGLIFWETMEADADRWAVWWRYRAAHSIGRGDWCAYFGGRSIVPSSQAGPPYWRVNRPGRQVMFSAYHLSAKTANDYLSEIARRRVPWLHGYPSFLALIATYALDSGFRFGDPIRIVTTGAENLLPQQKELIERAFGAPVRQHYGQSEGVANFSECPHGRLHVDEDYSFVEFLPTEMPDQYRVVGTNLTNTAFPFLRYDTQDVVTISGSQCDCGWSGRVVDRVDGRQEDYLVLSDGSRVGRLDHILKDMVEIREAQFRQSAPGKAVLLVVPGPNYSEAAEARLRAELRERLGDRVQVTICHTDRIERTRAGKLRLVVSEMPKERVE